MSRPQPSPARHATARAVRGALWGFLLAAAVIVGLLLMHSFNLHGASGPAVGTGSHGIHAPVQASTDVQHLDQQAAVACQGCDQGTHHDLLAGSCVLALLIVLLVLARPSLLHVAGARVTRAGPSQAAAVHRIARPPSLHALGISRT